MAMGGGIRTGAHAVAMRWRSATPPPPLRHPSATRGSQGGGRSQGGGADTPACAQSRPVYLDGQHTSRDLLATPRKCRTLGDPSPQIRQFHHVLARAAQINFASQSLVDEHLCGGSCNPPIALPMVSLASATCPLVLSHPLVLPSVTERDGCMHADGHVPRSAAYFAAQRVQCAMACPWSHLHGFWRMYQKRSLLPVLPMLHSSHPKCPQRNSA